MTVEFVKDKVTKNTHRYTATGTVSGSIYVQKDSELAKANVVVVDVAVKE